LPDVIYVDSVLTDCYSFYLLSCFYIIGVNCVVSVCWCWPVSVCVCKNVWKYAELIISYLKSASEVISNPYHIFQWVSVYHYNVSQRNVSPSCDDNFAKT